MDPLRSSGLSPQRPLTATPPLMPRRADTAFDSTQPPQADQITLSSGSARPAVEHAVPCSPSIEQPPTQAPSLAPRTTEQAAPATLTVLDTPQAPAPAAAEDTHFVLQAFRGGPLDSTSEMQTVKERLGLVPADVRSAAAMPLLDVLTTPSVKEASGQLGAIGTALTWAQKFKKEASTALAQGGFDEVMKRAAAASEAAAKPATATSLDEVLQSPSLLKRGRLGDDQIAEASNLIDQFKGGNHNPGLGTSTLGKGISYLRGRHGTRIFFRVQDQRPEWLAVVNKSEEQAAIRLLRTTFDLR